MNQNQNILKYQASIAHNISETVTEHRLLWGGIYKHEESQIRGKVRARSRGLLAGTSRL